MNDDLAKLQRENALLKAALKIGALAARETQCFPEYEDNGKLIEAWKEQAVKFYPGLKENTQ